MGKGRITKEDVDYLIEITFGEINIGELEQPLRKGLYKKAIDTNYAYACSHKDEFTTEEFNKLQKSALKTTLQEVLTTELNAVAQNEQREL